MGREGKLYVNLVAKIGVGLAAVSLTACQPPVRLAAPPPELLTCAGEPDAPDLPAQQWLDLAQARAIQMQRDVMMLDYVLAYRTVHGDCRGKLAGVKAWAETVD